MKIMPVLLFTVAFTLLEVHPSLGDDASAGKKKSVNCSACHGKDGISRLPDTPNLAGQKKKYLVNAIKAYRSGARQVHTMSPTVKSLANEDINNIAEYYAGLKPPCAPPAPRNR